MSHLTVHHSKFGFATSEMGQKRRFGRPDRCPLYPQSDRDSDTLGGREAPKQTFISLSTGLCDRCNLITELRARRAEVSEGEPQPACCRRATKLKATDVFAVAADQ